MKKITVIELKKEYTYIEIESLLELSYLFHACKSELDNFLVHLLKTDEPLYRWDHIEASGFNKALFSASVQTAKLKGSSVFMEMNDLINIRNKGLFETINDYGSVCIMPTTGSYRQPFKENEDYIKIKEVVEIDAIKPELTKYDNYMRNIGEKEYVG